LDTARGVWVQIVLRNGLKSSFREPIGVPQDLSTVCTGSQLSEGFSSAAAYEPHGIDQNDILSVPIPAIWKAF